MFTSIKSGSFVSSAYCMRVRDGLLELRPKRVSYKWQKVETVGAYTLVVHELFEVTAFAGHSKRGVATTEFCKWCNKDTTYKTVLSAGNIREGGIDDNGNEVTGVRCTVEDFRDGRYSYQSDFVSKVYRHGALEVDYTKYGAYECYEYFDDGKRDMMLILIDGKLLHCIMFEDDKHCYECLPTSMNKFQGVSPLFVLEVSGILLALGAVGWYFQSLFASLAVLGLSFGLLAMTEHHNPQHRGIVRVLYILVYAIIVFFLK